MDTANDVAPELLAAILDQLTEGVIVANPAGQITYVNEAAERLHGVARLGVEPDDFSETYHLFKEDGQPYPSADLPLSRAITGETIVDARWRIQRPDGTWILAIGSARPIRNALGAQVAAVLTLRDDTQRDAAERELAENEARLRALTDNLPGASPGTKMAVIWRAPSDVWPKPPSTPSTTMQACDTVSPSRTRSRLASSRVAVVGSDRMASRSARPRSEWLARRSTNR